MTNDSPYGNISNPSVWLNNYLPVNGGANGVDNVQMYSLVVQNIISNKINACPQQYIRSTGHSSVVRFDVGEVSQGNDILGAIYQGSTLWATFDIPAGTSSLIFTSGQLAALTDVTIGSFWRLDITQVGGIFPGSNLVVTIVV
jgi:hypothetical protein